MDKIKPLDSRSLSKSEGVTDKKIAVWEKAECWLHIYRKNEMGPSFFPSMFLKNNIQRES